MQEALFASIELARRIDGAEARLSAEIARAVATRRPDAKVLVEDVAGGVAVFAGALSPVNKMIGLGYAGMPDEARLSQIESAFAARSAAVQAEVATLADPGLHTMLCRRGYVLQGFENVLGASLGDPLIGNDDEPGFARDLALRHEVTLVDQRDVPTWGSMLMDSFESPDTQGVPGDLIPPREVVEQVIGDMLALPHVRRYVVRHEGEMIAGASLRVDDRVAQLIGSATLPPFRRRGLQTAFIRCRLADAKQLGCDVAVVTTAPGSKSQQNLQKQGFALLYSRAILVKPPS